MKRQRVKTELPEAVVNRHDVHSLIRRIARNPQGYITLASVGEGRKERQLGRLDLRRNLRLMHWVSDGVAFVLKHRSSDRLRLRWWGRGGKPVEGVMLRLAVDQPRAAPHVARPRMSNAPGHATDWSSKRVPVTGNKDEPPESPPVLERNAHSASAESAWRLMAEKAEARLKDAESDLKTSQAQQSKLNSVLAKMTDEVKDAKLESQQLRQQLAECHEAMELFNNQIEESLTYLES